MSIGTAREYFDAHNIKYDDCEFEIPCSRIHDGMSLRFCIHVEGIFKYGEIVKIEGYLCERCEQLHLIVVNADKSAVAPIDAFLIHSEDGEELMVGFEEIYGGLQ